MAITILSYLLLSSRMVGNRFLLLWAEPYLFLPTLETTDFAEKQAARIKYLPFRVYGLACDLKLKWSHLSGSN